MNKQKVSLVIRFLIFVLFIVSAVAKMFPIWAFEKQLVDLNLMSWCLAPYFSRALIAVELALGIMIIQSNYLKRVVIPATIALLVIFCGHLSIEMVKHGAMSGNCGCFGQLIPMTPLEAFIKNVITIMLLLFVYRNSVEDDQSKNRFSVLLIIWLFSTLLMYVAFPFCPCAKATAPVASSTVIDEDSEEAISITEKGQDVLGALSSDSGKLAIDTAKKDTAALEVGPSKVKSRFSDYAIFNNKKVNIDNGKKIVCFFAAGCDHCQNAAKTLVRMSKKPGFPKIYIFFMDEETFKIPEFFQYAQAELPYRVLDIPTFWTVLQQGTPDASTPGVFYLWNGNVIKNWVGIDEKAFKEQELNQVLNKK
ncbi:MAG: MauE/DoxX family redox-associated membrane protein [Bacteroidota bacterium]